MGNLMYTEEHLIEELQYFAVYLGKTPTMLEVSKDTLLPSAAVYSLRFNSWEEALKRANLKTNKLTDQGLLKLLKTFSEKLGRTPSIREVDSEAYMPSVKAYRNHFGCWNNALKAAKLPLNYITDEDLLNNLKSLTKRLGRVPTALDARKENLSSVTTYKDRFGSWNNAIIKAGLKPNCSQSHITEENLALSYNKEWLKEQNQTKTLYEISSELGFNKHAMSGRFKELGIKPVIHKESLKEKEWLDSLGITERQYPIANYKVDGYNPDTNTVYEFLGDYWHGNPEVYDPDDYNEKVGKTFGQLFDETRERLERIKSLGYNIITKWET